MDEIPALGDWLELAPWRTPAVTILRVRTGFDSRTSHTVAGKQEMVNEFNSRELFVVWTGKYRSDVRSMTEQELEQVAELLAREPYPLPRLEILDQAKRLRGLGGLLEMRYENLKLVGYQSHGKIAAAVAV